MTLRNQKYMKGGGDPEKFKLIQSFFNVFLFGLSAAKIQGEVQCSSFEFNTKIPII